MGVPLKKLIALEEPQSQASPLSLLQTHEDFQTVKCPSFGKMQTESKGGVNNLVVVLLQ